ncbi:MAG: hypothetical protein HOH58_18300 [Opitutaceae bacterium]|jgi:hypothetical protein|nr:hypothetical protein [Opitutaceae bacterium]
MDSAIYRFEHLQDFDVVALGIDGGSQTPEQHADDITAANTITGVFKLNNANADSALIITLSPGP